MDDMTNKAIQASGIFSSYMAEEIAKQNANKKTAEEIAQENLDLLSNFENFQDKINSSLKLKKAFSELQQIFKTNDSYTASIDPLFVEAVLLLKLD